MHCFTMAMGIVLNEKELGSLLGIFLVARDKIQQSIYQDLLGLMGLFFSVKLFTCAITYYSGNVQNIFCIIHNNGCCNALIDSAGCMGGDKCLKVFFPNLYEFEEIYYLDKIGLCVAGVFLIMWIINVTVLMWKNN